MKATELRRPPALAAAIFAAALLCAPPASAMGPDSAAVIGAPAPDFTVTDAAGASVSLQDLRGKTVVLEWTNKECPFVRKHYDGRNMQGLQAALDVTWISVISSAPGKGGHMAPAAALAHAKSEGASPDHVIVDEGGTLGRLYGAQTTPHMYVIAPTGTLAYMGAIDDQPSARPATLEGAVNYVKAAVGDIAAGKAVATPVTAPYGCSIKY